MLRAPCQNCPDRTLGCFATCEKYKAFCLEREMIRKKRRQEGIMIDYKQERITLLKHRKGREK